uniref:Uncharacterized protein n=1 Tax=Panagrolaimus sp. JU765 TaxID=591449 RepID=A0AC34Q3Y5_9BILA
MKEYRRFIALYTAFDGTLAFFLGILLQPRLYFPATGGVIQGVARDLYLWLGPEKGEPLVKMAMVGVVWMAVNVITCQDGALIYRFTVVATNQIYHDLIMRPIVVIVTVICDAFLCILFSVLCYISIADFKDVPQFQQVYLEMAGPHIFDGVPKDAIWIWYEQTGTKTLYFLTCILSGFLASEIFCLGLGFVILRTLKKNAANFSAKTYKLHQQLTILLILQLLTPIIFFIVPISASIFAMIFNLKYQKPADDIGFIFFSLYSSSNSSLTIIFVSPYRKFTWDHTFGLVTKWIPWCKRDTSLAVILPQKSTGFTINSQNMRNMN